jgi:hypothetical protein
MAEAFAILGVIASMIQIVDFGSKALAGSQQLYKSVHGVRDDHRHLILLAENTRVLSERAKTALGASKKHANTHDGKRIHSLAVECDELASEIIQTVDEMRLPSKVRLRKLEALKLTVRGIRKRSGLEELAGRMENIDKRLRAELSDMLSE